MQHKNYFLLFLLALAALTASAQTCPGPPNRTALINLQKSNIVNGTRWGQTVLTDTCGNQRYVTLDSLIVLIVDSIQVDTNLLRNWYNSNDTTTDLGRVAFVLRTAWWRTVDSLGFYRFTNRPDNFNGSQFTIYQDSITLDADTIVWKSSWHPELQFHELQAEGTYFYADSLKYVAIGQFPDFPNLNNDGTEKGIFLEEGTLFLINGDGVTGAYSQTEIGPNFKYLDVVADAPGVDYGQIRITTTPTSTDYVVNVIEDSAPQTDISMIINQASGTSIWGVSDTPKDTNFAISVFLGESNSSASSLPYGGRRAFGVKSQDETNWQFYWLLSYLPNDTTENAVSFYNRAYYWKNEHPTGAAGDTLLHFWAATGPGGEAGKDPGFMTIDAIRAGAPNIYNSNGQQTDNTRIDTIRQTIEFTRLNTGSSFEPGFQVSARAGNRPAAQGWYFNDNADSILIYKTGGNVAFLESASMPFGFAAVSDYIFLDGDSLLLNFGLIQNTDNGDILVAHGTDIGARTVNSLEGTFNADQLSWNAGAAGDKWFAVPANRTSIATTSASLIPAESVAEILVDGTGGGTVELNYTPAMPAAGYTTYRYIYNATAGATTVDTDQAWQFRDNTGDIGTSFNLAAGENCKLLWIYDATAANARFFVIKF